MSSPPDIAIARSDHAYSPRPHPSPAKPQDHERTINLARRRQKISLACDDCRAKKIRCDGLRPQCTACRRKGFERPCRYYQAENSRGLGSRSIIRSLQERLDQLEGRVRCEQAVGGSSPNARTSPTIDDRSSGRLMEGDDIAVGHQSLDEQPQKHHPLPREQGQCPSPVSSMATTAQSQQESHPLPLSADRHRNTSDQHMNESAEEDGSINAMGMASLPPHGSTPREFYGRSSAASFFSHIQERLNYGSPSARPFESQTGPSCRAKARPPRQDLEQALAHSDDFHLPPRNTADHLINLYSDRVQCLYPYIHWPTLIQAYQRLWISDDELKASGPPRGVGLGGPQCSQRVFYCALNVMFALAVQFSAASAKEKKDMAKPFARRARHLLRLDYLDHGDLSLVQALMIMAHYLQSTNLPTRCWNVAGLALRMAQGLGLHLDTENDASPLFREMRRRVWYGCICLDVVLAMTLGRPTLSSRRSASALPGTLEEEKPSSGPANDRNPVVASSTAAFFTETTKLYMILDNILSQVYDPWKETEASGLTETQEDVENSPQLSCLVALDAQLDHFESTIPDILRWHSHHSHGDGGGVLQRQRNVLRTRLLHTRVMLYRPPFVRLCQQSKDLGARQVPSAANSKFPGKHRNCLPSLLADQCSIACIENAESLVEHINTTSQSDKTGARWFNAYYVYHSAMVLTLAELCPTIRQRLDRASLSESWQHCQDFLHRTIEHDSESFKYLRALNEISKYVRFDDSATIVRSSLNSDREVRQDEVVNHILNSCLDPSLAPWLDGPLQLDPYLPFTGDEFEQEIFRDDASEFTGSTLIEGGGFMGGGWPGTSM